MLRTPAARMAEIEYPERDGKPMAETDTHRDILADFLLYPLRERYDQQSNVYISGNLLIYYQEGNPKVSVAPDVFVVFGVPNRERRIYKVWEEGKAPDVVFELTSKKTRNEDWGDKRWLYEELGVQEYFLFDPMREYLKPPLQGFRLDGAYFVALEPEQLPDGEWQLESNMLGLILRTKGRILRLYDPQEEEFLRNHGEEAKGRRAAEQRAVVEAKARRAAEQRTAAAEAEVARLRALLQEQQKL